MLIFARVFLLAAVPIALSGCVHTDSKISTLGVGTPLPNATVLFMEPDVELSLLTTGGAREPRADWTEAAKANIMTEIENEVRARGTKTVQFDTKSSPSDHVMQLVHLHEAVGATVMGSFGAAKLPNKDKVFDWSLGPGVSELADTYHADYALFVFARGSYASSGRVAVAMVAAVFRVAVPLGTQQAFVTLVDLHTGNIVWIGFAATGEHDDMSTPDGAASVAKEMMASIPLGGK